MKYKFLTSCLLLGLWSARLNAASEFYVNDGVVLCPPQVPPNIDATNFVNNNFFSINFTNGVPQLFTTANTRNFTNTGSMIANTGFRFDTAPPGSGTHTMAGNFVNSGTISSGSALNNTNNFFDFFFFGSIFGFGSSNAKMLVSATNVSLRSSTNIVGVDGLISLNGKKVDMNRAYLSIEGFEENADSLFANFDTLGLTAAYWGNGQNVMNPANNFESIPPFTPNHFVNLPSGFGATRTLILPNATFYVSQFAIGTNIFVNAVFLNNTNAAIINNVYFPFFGESVVEWIGLATNQVTGSVTTNLLYLTDTFGTFGTNTSVTNFSYYSAAGTAQPINYTFTRFNPFLGGLGVPSPATSPVGIFNASPVTNDYAAFGALFVPTTVNLTNLPPAGRYLTNLPGRIEISADANLDLTLARISGPNYMGLKATNHIVSTSGAKISVPFSDINLATTNGNLAITNLLYPIVQRFTGEVDLWSGRWTNGGTRYSVLFVDSKLDPTAPSQVQDLTLRSTNVVISDILNVTRNMLINAERVTITTNQQPAATPRGEINLKSSLITWSSSMPRLQYLTNSGAISSLNAIFFGGARTSPFYSSNFNEPYLAFVNHGPVTSEGDLIWANYFENTGMFSMGIGFGSLTLQSLNAQLRDGSFLAPKGDISISSGNLVVTNHLFQAGRAISLSITNFISDGGVGNANFWSAKGINLYNKPAIGDLLHTTISNTVAPGIESVNTWAGENRGCTSAGFANNVAIGKLILDGGSDSLFTFTGTGANNAIYIDYLDLRNFMTNRDAVGNFVGLQVDPNMMVYFAQAVANGVSIAEKLDKQNGGRFCWISDYAGFYSGINVVYPDGSTNFFNASLVGSCNLDSDGDGLVNCSDPTPILRPQDLSLSVSLISAPSLRAQVSWQTGPYAANYVYYKTNAMGSNWQLLTNFVSGSLGGRVSVQDPVNPKQPRYYRVRVDAQQP